MIALFKEKFAEFLLEFFVDKTRDELQNMIEIPPENIPGDLAFPCFTLAKDLRKSPNIISQEISDK